MPRTPKDKKDKKTKDRTPATESAKSGAVDEPKVSAGKQQTLWLNPRAKRTGSVSVKLVEKFRVGMPKHTRQKIYCITRADYYGFDKPILLPNKALFDYFKKLTFGGGIPMFLTDKPGQETWEDTQSKGFSTGGMKPR